MDNRDEHVYTEFIEKHSLVNKEKEVLFISFMDNYKDISPKDLKNTFKNFSDVKTWLEKTFKEEIDNFKKDPKIYLMVAKTELEDKIVGVAIFELFKDLNCNVIHVKQLGILPEYQNRGIGTKLLFSIKNSLPNLDLITVDTGKINVKAYQFYKKLGFSLASGPNDRSLDADKYYGFVLKLSSCR